MSSPPASVVIACHADERFNMLVAAVNSACAQSPAPEQIIVAVDHNPGLVGRLRRATPGVTVVEHTGARGASGARNAGAALATAPLIAFLDDDVVAQPGWLPALLAPFADAGVVGTGGRTRPAWQARRPHWFPDEFGWVVGASHAGLPTAEAPVRNVWSENMAVRRDAFEAVGGFRAGFGKLGSFSRPEDTDFCIRIRAASPGSRWLYVPGAVIDHVVPAERSRFRFFVRRCYSEGAGKVELSAQLGRDSDLDDERSYLMRTVPRAFLRDLLSGRLARAGSILVGVAAAGAGGATSLARLGLRSRRRS